MLLVGIEPTLPGYVVSVLPLGYLALAKVEAFELTSSS